VVPNGTDTARFRPDGAWRERIRGDLGIPPESVVAVHSARADPMKDHPTLLAAAAALPEVLFILMGAGTEGLGPLPANVRALGVQDRPEEIYAAGDIVASSSAFGEGFSNAVAEGMAAGLVPVCTDVGDARAIVGETGPIVPPRDASALASALRQAAALDADERRARGLAARARIEERFSVARAADGFLSAWALDSRR
jgi:glycosyltransferase involved in cell wall biosynthesis